MSNEPGSAVPLTSAQPSGHHVGNIVKVQSKQGGEFKDLPPQTQQNDEESKQKINQNEKIRQIHNQLNKNAENYSKMYDIIQKEKEKAAGKGANANQSENYDDLDEEESESEDELFDYNVLSKLRF